MDWVYKRLDDIESLLCHLCRKEMGKKKAGLIQVDGGMNGNVTSGLYHDDCWEKLKADKEKLEKSKAKVIKLFPGRNNA